LQGNIHKDIPVHPDALNRQALNDLIAWSSGAGPNILAKLWMARGQKIICVTENKFDQIMDHICPPGVAANFEILNAAETDIIFDLFPVGSLEKIFPGAQEFVGGIMSTRVFMYCCEEDIPIGMHADEVFFEALPFMRLFDLANAGLLRDALQLVALFKFAHCVGSQVEFGPSLI